jgi:hypothetical protein
MTSVTNLLIAARVDSTSAWTGIGLAEDVEMLVSSFDSGSWIDGSIGGFAAGLDVLATVTDPLGQLVSWGVAWLIEHVKPLSDALDWLAGDPDQITAYAGTWTNVAAAMRDAGADLDAAIRADLVEWQSAAADAYRRLAGEQREALSAAGAAVEAMSAITLGTGLVIALVRELVRDLIAEFVAVLAVRLWEWLAIAGGTLGVGVPWVVAQVSALAAKWAAKITRLLTGLISSLRRLAPMLSRLDDILRRLHEILTRLARHDPATDPGILFRQAPIAKNGAKVLMTIENVRAVVGKYGIDYSGVKVVINKGRDGVAGVTGPTGTVYLNRAAFRSEEELARTLAHERFHVQQIRDGIPYPKLGDDTERWEKPARDYEKQWWESHQLNRD